MKRAIWHKMYLLHDGLREWVRPWVGCCVRRVQLCRAERNQRVPHLQLKQVCRQAAWTRSKGHSCSTLHPQHGCDFMLLPARCKVKGCMLVLT